MSQTTLESDELQNLLTEKKRLEKLVEHYREEFKRAKSLAREQKHKLREVIMKIGNLTKRTDTRTEGQIQATD